MDRTWKPQGRSRELLLHCQRLLDEYNELITLRQLFYLLVKEDIITNDEASWRKLKALTLRARKNGRLSPTAFSLTEEKDASVPTDADTYLQKVVSEYRIPRTEGQENYVEIWVEREPLNRFVERLFSQYDVPVFVTGGYSSYSFIHSTAKRLKKAVEQGKTPKVLYLADFNASSFKMFELLSTELGYAVGLSRDEMASILFRVAVLPEHIVSYSLPESYSKSREAENKRYQEVYGQILTLLELQVTSCVEIESIGPVELCGLIKNVLFTLLDPVVMGQVAELEEAVRKRMEQRLGE